MRKCEVKSAYREVEAVYEVQRSKGVRVLNKPKTINYRINNKQQSLLLLRLVEFKTKLNT